MTGFSDPQIVATDIVKQREGPLALFIDFDGTLVDIASTPDGITVSSHVGDVLSKLNSSGIFVALVSGRGVEDLRNYVPDYSGYISGGHGAELWDGSKVTSSTTPPSNVLDDAFTVAHSLALKHVGVEVEEKATGVVIHYRNAPDAKDAAIATVKDICDTHSFFEIHHAKSAVEACPRGVTKGTALRQMLSTLDTPIPVAIGDDETDEDMFEEVINAGGYAVKVGGGDTVAQYSLKGPNDVFRFLNSIYLQKMDR